MIEVLQLQAFNEGVVDMSAINFTQKVVCGLQKVIESELKSSILIQLPEATLEYISGSVIADLEDEGVPDIFEELDERLFQYHRQFLIL